MPSGHSGYHEPDVVRGRVNHLRTKTPGSETWTDQENVRTFQAQCSCGFRGPTRTSHYEAEDDCVQHRIAEND